MSTREVSSIKPKIDGKAPTYDEGIKFKYSMAAYDSFAKEGFIPPEPQYRSDKRERQFLSQVDVSKGKITNTGRMTADYIKDTPREVHSIPFSKTEVDKVLKGEHPFGPDSVNISDLSRVVFYGKFEGMLGVMNFRRADFTYEQFTVPEWKKFVELATKKGGPANRAYVEEQGQFIT